MAAESLEFSIPLLIAAAGAAAVWLAGAAALGMARRPPRIRATGATMELPPEPPALAGLLVNDFVLPGEAAPATVLDLAARRVLDLDEVQPGRTICRLRPTTGDTDLTAYEQRVLASLREKAVDGVVPTDALTTGPDVQSKTWHRSLAKEVVADAQARGLTHNRWSSAMSAGLFLGLAVVGVLLYAALDTGGDTSGDRDVVAAITGGFTVGVLMLGAVVLTRMGRSLAQLPTRAGLAAATVVAGLQRHIRDADSLADLPPASVKLRDRHFAYAAAFGLAPLAVELLPMGAEDDHRAWSRVGNRWRRVRVRYPRTWPPAWGKHPGFATFLAVTWGAAAIFVISQLRRVADSAPPSGISPIDWQWVERGSIVVMVPFALVIGWAVIVLVRAVPDFWATRTITGTVVRDRRFRQWLASGEDPKYWNYLAIDTGTEDRVVAFRLRESLWREHNQGDEVTAEVTPGLGYVRSMVKKSA